jgi:hypothetical protein
MSIIHSVDEFIDVEDEVSRKHADQDVAADPGFPASDGCGADPVADLEVAEVALDKGQVLVGGDRSGGVQHRGGNGVRMM